jgi:primosomal protein N' (replication factor Y)
MTCHYCGFTTEIPAQCPACENPDLRSRGFGTERIEEDLQKLFPEARIARLDLDTTRTRSAYEQILEDFAAHRTDILVGTQMVAKGLDFGRVSVVGILSADTMLCQPDFRAYERSFQMLTQVAGRAGRRDSRGYVLLQTLTPDLSLIRQVVADDYASAYREQMLERREFAYPPFMQMIIVYVRHRRAADADLLARELTLRLRQLLGTRVLGPDEPPVARVQGLSIRRIILKLERNLPIARIKQNLLSMRTDLLAQKAFASGQILFDVDPL